jgi:hypothetical protein
MHAFLFASLLTAAAAAQTSTYAVFTVLAPPVQPPDRTGALMAHDEARNRTLLAGGQPPGGGTALQQTWEFDGAAWQQVFPTTQLNFTKQVRLAYAPQRSQIVAVTGDDVGGPASPPMRVYGWTGANWLLLDANGPPSRAEHYEIAWDGQRGVLVMFGEPWGAETWEWGTSGWSLRGTGGPVPRSRHRMAYDEARQRVVLCGGVSHSNQPLVDTWEWNGVYWLERFGITPPGTSSGAAIGYDRARQRVVLHGGYSGGNATGGVWEFDGAGWTSRPSNTGPFAMVGASMAYLPSTGRMLLFGGAENMTLHRTRTLAFVTGHVANSAAHGAGCLGPVGVPQLGALAGSRPVLGSTFALRFTSLPSTPLALVFATLGFSDQTWNGVPLPLDLTPLGFSACQLHVAPGVLEPLANLGGFANWNIAVPSTPALDGAVFFLQGLVLTPGFNPGGAVTTSSVRGVAGVL